MKQFAKPFLSALLLLSVAAEAVESGSGSGSTIASTFSGGTGSGQTQNSDGGKKASGRSGSERCGDKHGGQACSSTLFLPRPQGSNEARFLNPLWYGPDGEQCLYLDIGYRYRQSWKGDRIARCIFGSDKIEFAGSQADHKKGEFLADNIGLAPNFRGTLKLEPRIRDHMFDFETRWELGSCMECLEGAYFKLRGTVVHTRWELRECETITTSTNTTFSNFAPGYMSSVESSDGSLPGVNATDSIITALSGNFTFGDNTEPWRFGRFKGRDNTTNLANLDLMLGYDFLLCDEYHLGAYIKTTAPTGTKPNSQEVFQAIAGNAHHWELGGGLDAHYEFWNCDDQSLAVWLNGYVTHLFKDTQWRSFDLKSSRDNSGCLSRYTLLKEFTPDNKYAGHLIPGVNWLGRRVESSFAVQGDAALRLLYRSCGWALGVGYNVFGRTHEKLENACQSECTDTLTRRVGIKGTSDVRNPSRASATDSRVSSATQSQHRPMGDHTVGIDNATPLNDYVTAASARTGDDHQAHDSLSGSENQKREPKLLVCERDINFGGEERVSGRKNSKDGKAGKDSSEGELKEEHREHRGVRSYLSHKFFATIDYQWEEYCDDYRPFLGVGGEVEFAQNGECHVCTPNLWGAWVRTGVNF